MNTYKSHQIIGQLGKEKGGYHFLKIEAEIINQFKNKRHTRFLCTLENRLTFQCGINHLGDGNFFIILSGSNLSTIQKKSGDEIHFELNEDPNPLGVDIPETLEVFLEQDQDLNEIFDKLTPGKKRNIIHQIIRIKDLDRQIQKSIFLIKESNQPRKKRII